EFSAALLLHELQDACIQNLRNFVFRSVGILCYQEVFVVRQARSMVEQIADSDGFPVGGEFGKDVGEVVVVMQLAVMDEEHDAGGSELLSKRGETEIRVGFDGMPGAQICDAVSLAKGDLPFIDDENRRTGSIRGLQRGKNGADLARGNLGHRDACEYERADNCEDRSTQGPH